jgi:hypothetical protein
MFNPVAKRMKFATKEALLLTIPDGGDGPDRWRESSRFVFYIDTDAEKIAFINWYIIKLQVTDLFQNADTPFHGLMASFPDGSSALFFECDFEFLEEHGEDERVFPVGSDANKLALFEHMISGELDEILGLHLKKVKARVVMDTEKTSLALETNLPMEIAEKIVASAVSED